MKNTEKWTDVIGIGFGPANIALAIAATELESPLSFKFLERRNCPSWQDEMLLPGSDIQNHPLRDLVTPRNPRSKYTVTNFLFEHNRLFEHLNLPLIHPLRLNQIIVSALIQHLNFFSFFMARGDDQDWDTKTSTYIAEQAFACAIR